MTASAETVERTFDPSRYLTKIPRRMRDASGAWTTSESDYLEVKWRLLWLRTDHPDAAVETDLVSHVDSMAVFRARVSIPGGGSATGWGHETAADFEDYLEKAETKALGRALAALGYGTQFCEDFEFEQAPTRQGERLRVVDSPVQRAPDGQVARRPAPAAGVRPASRGNQPQSGDAPPATEPQVKAIYAIARGSLALDEAELDERCRDRYGVPPQELTRRQASEFIDALKMGAANSLN
jgi:hypothetical protein